MHKCDLKIDVENTIIFKRSGEKIEKRSREDREVNGSKRE